MSGQLARIFLLELLIAMILTQKPYDPMTYQSIEQVNEPRLALVAIATNAYYDS